VLRFGAFELDLRTQELRKSGVRLRLPKQSFIILAYLAGCPGKVVTRDELRHVLWDDKTYVDFDRCLNTAVNRLREVLNDSAEAPRFIETLPRKGYRLLAHVESVVQTPDAAPASIEVSEPLPASIDPPVRSRFRFLAAAAVAAALIVPTVWIAVARSNGVQESGSVHLITREGSALTPALSRDGSRVAFAWRQDPRPDHDIYVQKLGSASPTQLSSGPADDFSPAFSPDGRQVAFYRRTGDGIAIYLGSLSDGRTQRFSGLQVGPGGPATNRHMSRLESISWSPDAKYLAYVDRESPSQPNGIFRISLDTRVHEQVTSPGSRESDGAPAFSPDGKWLAFVRSDGVSDGVYILPLDRGEARRITAESAAITGLTWTADSRNIVFASNRASEPRLWSIALTGEAAQPVTQAPEAAVFPSIAAQGSGLVFLRPRPRSRIQILSLATAGKTESVELAVASKIDNPRFSPDGKHIAFSADDREGNREIWISAADGSKPYALTSLRSIGGSPRWSPDGKWIAFDSMARGSWDVYVVPVEGGTPQLLSNTTSDDVRPSWSSDGQSIYFASDASGTMQIWKVPRSGGSARQITTKGGYEAVEAPDGKCIFYTRKGVAGL
jgi:Tol biopolymer transport system component/DNA-binding winged helix-turn-helix (wHTH) protein